MLIYVENIYIFDKTNKGTMKTETKYTKQIGNDTYVLNVCRDSVSGSLVYQMWVEQNEKQVRGTWTTRRRLDKETKQFFGI